ncbi:hypothetical protein KY339_03490 [Candidatus Woesearchaeota archaeon]|nr:hypothetical protein [Candidatus Woesearchaeota archaeon]
MAKRKKKEPTWEEVGKFMGKKFGKEFEKEGCSPWKKSWAFCGGDHGGGFVGRLIFIFGLIFALKAMGTLAAAPTWTIVFLIIGFALMKF